MANGLTRAEAKALALAFGSRFKKMRDLFNSEATDPQEHAKTKHEAKSEPGYQTSKLNDEMDFRWKCMARGAFELNMTVGAEAANVINVAVDVCHHKKGTTKNSGLLRWWLSDTADGLTPSTVAPSGGIAIGTSGVLLSNNGSLDGEVFCGADSKLDLDITEAGAKTYYLVFVMADCRLVVSPAITFA